MNTSVPKWSLVQSATVDIDLNQDKINASTEGIKALSAEVQMRRDSRSNSQEHARMLIAHYESDQKTIQWASTGLASSQHELDNLDDTIPKHLETEIGPTGAPIKMEYINILKDDIAGWTRMLKAAQAPSLSLERLQKKLDDCNGVIKQYTHDINKVQEQLNTLLVRHRTLELERQQLLDRRQHDVCSLLPKHEDFK